MGNSMDWNWFFSSLAQSTAAIVGIFGAFIFTKIIGNEAEYHRKRSKFKELVNRAVRLEDEADNRYFSWYNQQVEIDEIDRLIKRLDEPNLLTPEEYIAELNFSPYVPVDEVLALIRSKLEEETRLQESPPPSNSMNPLMAMPVDLSRTQMDITRSQMRMSLRAQLEAEREAIERLRVEVDDHIRSSRRFLEEVKNNPESSSAISKSIVAALLLFFVGVVYPLSFMPIPIGAHPALSFSFESFFTILLSLRGILLLSVSTIFSGVMLAFFILNKKLKYPPDDLKELEHLLSIDSYSSYFAIQDENRKWWSDRSK